MSRTDQYIGLIHSAKEFVDKLIPLESYSIDGAWNEITLGKWKEKTAMPNGFTPIYKEIVQEEPWSSGPMYFTCLEIDYGNGFKIRIFEWRHNPELGRWYGNGQEYDAEKGEFWV